MDIVPDFVVELDASLKRRETKYTRVSMPEERARFIEENWDEVLADNADVLASALQAADLLGEAHTLVLLGLQPSNIDLVFAEVDQAGRAVRLVLVEDKLSRNPQAKREVLAQLVEYSQTVRDEWSSAEELISAVGSANRRVVDPAWLRTHAADLADSARTGNMLLVIAGDSIDRGLLRLARRFSQHDPLGADLALVSLSLYSLGEGRGYLFLPHVVSAVERNERPLTLVVEVRDREGPLPATLKIAPATVSPKPGPSPNPAATAFLLRVMGAVLPSATKLNQEKALGLYLPKSARKSLELSLSRERGYALFRVYFGDDAASWSPLCVELEMNWASPADAASHRVRLEAQLAAGELRDGFRPAHSMKQRVILRKAHPCPTTEQLTDELMSQVVADFEWLLTTFASAPTEGPGI